MKKLLTFMLTGLFAMALQALTIDGYTVLDYIESNGSQWIDTGLKPSAELVTTVVVTPSDNTAYLENHAILGSAWAVDGYFLMYAQQWARFHYGTKVVDVTKEAGEWEPGVKMTMTCGASEFIVNGHVNSMSGNNGSNIQNNIFLFWTGDQNAGTTSLRGRFKLHHCTMVDNGVTVRDFYPVRSPNGDIGLYDSANTRFYGRANGNAFAAGPDIIVAEGDSPIGAYYNVSDVTETGATIAFAPGFLGEGAMSLDASLVVVSPIGSNTIAFSSSFTDTSSQTVALSGLMAGVEYKCYVTMENDNQFTGRYPETGFIRFKTAAEDFGFGANARPGFYQAYVNGNAWADKFDILASDVLAFSQAAWSGITTGSWTAEFCDMKSTYHWGDNQTWGYLTYMYFDKDTTYTFGQNIDDYCSFYVDETQIYSGGGVGGGQPGAKYTYKPETSGWKELRIYTGNGTGGYGPYSGFIGTGISTDGGANWKYFANCDISSYEMLDETPFCIFGGEGVSIKGAYLADGVFNAVIGYPVPAVGSIVKVYAADRNLGTDIAEWGDPIATLPAFDGQYGEIAVELADGNDVLRIVAEKGALIWCSPAIAVSGVSNTVPMGETELFDYYGDVNSVTVDADDVYSLAGDAEATVVVRSDVIIIKTENGGTESLGVVKAGSVLDFGLESAWTMTIEPYDAIRQAKVVTSDDVTITGGDYTTLEYGPYVVYKLLDTTAAYTVSIAEAGHLDYLLVGGGGGGGMTAAAGGGGGGFVYREHEYVAALDIPVRVGKGGAGDTTQVTPGENGGESSFARTIAYGGGGGGSYSTQNNGNSGASGGGGSDGGIAGGAIYGDQGYPGGDSIGNIPGGGGGAGGPGQKGYSTNPSNPADTALNVAGAGGPGRYCSITGERIAYGGGGGGAAGVISWAAAASIAHGAPTEGKGGIGGGGDGGLVSSVAPGSNGVDGLGGGGGGGPYGNNSGNAQPGGRGGSGCVIIRVVKSGVDVTKPYVTLDSISDVSFTTVKLDATVHMLGTGADSISLKLAYGASADALGYEIAVTNAMDGTGTVAVSLDGFQPDTRYYAQLLADNGGGFEPMGDVVSFATIADGGRMPGFIQGRMSEYYSMEFDIADHALDRILKVPANVTDTVTAWHAIASDDRQNDYTWGAMVTYGYQGEMFFEDKPYAIGIAFDDNARICIGDDFMFDASSAFTVKSFTPSQGAGWYPVRIYLSNHSGGVGAMNGFVPGVGWNNKGVSTFSADNVNENWSSFADPGDASLVRCAMNSVGIASASQTDGTANLVVDINSSLVGGEFYVGFAENYALDEEGWQWTRLADVADGEISRNVASAIPQDAAYVRIMVRKNGQTLMSTSKKIDEIKRIDASLPVASFVKVSNTGADSAVVTFSVSACGGSYEVCDLELSYGYTPDDLRYSAEFTNFGLGVNSVRLTGLDAGLTYYASLHVVNASGAESAESEVFTFRTTALPTVYTGRPGTIGYSLPGVWQAYEYGAIKGTITNHLTLARTLGTEAAFVFFNPASPKWDGWTTDGEPAKFEWSSRYVFGYAGYMHMVGGHAYSFYGRVDDVTRIRIGETVMNGNGQCWFTPSEDGWYWIEVECDDAGGGNAGCSSLDGVTYTDATVDGTWHILRDPGDGSLLRTGLPVRDGVITDFSASRGDFTCTVAFGDYQDADTIALCLVYGDVLGSDDKATWENNRVIQSGITGETMSYAFNGLGDDTCGYARFYTAKDDGTWQWCGDALRIPDGSKPIFADGLKFDPSYGDKIIATGAVMAAGSGETATLKFLLSDNADMTDATEYIAGDYASEQAIDFEIKGDGPDSANYVVPGSRYYVRAVLTATDNEIAMSSVYEIETSAAALFAGPISASRDGNDGSIYFAADIKAAGAGKNALLELLVGTSESNLGVVDSCYVSDDKVTKTLHYDAATLNQRYYYQFRLSNSCSSESWEDYSSIGYIDIPDIYTYVWKSAIHEGDWSNPANWEVAGSPTLATFPNGASATAVFQPTDEDAATPYLIRLPGFYNANHIEFKTPGIDITFEGLEARDVGREKGANYGFKLNAPWESRYNAERMTVTFKDGRFELYRIYAHYQSSSPDHLTFIGDNAYLYMIGDTEFYISDARIILRNNAYYCQGGGNFWQSGAFFNLVIDDSTYIETSGGVMYLARTTGETTEACRIDFMGKRPVLEARQHVFAVFDASYVEETAVPELCFHVPEGGFEGFPIHAYNDNGWAFGAGNGTFAITLAKDSPARKAGRRITTPLVMSETAGKWFDGIELGEHLTYANILEDGSYEAAEKGAANYVVAEIPNSGFKVFIK